MTVQDYQAKIKRVLISEEEIALKIKDADKTPKGEKGYIGMADELVSCDKEFIPVAKFLLAKTAVQYKINLKTHSITQKICGFAKKAVLL